MTKPKPGKIKKTKREAKAMAAANRRASLMLGITLALGVPLFIMSVSVVPTRSPKDLVRAQAVRLKSSEAVNRSAPELATVENHDVLQGPGHGMKYSPVGFDVLSFFKFVVTDQMLNPGNPTDGSSKIMNQIPLSVQDLDQKPIALRGFLLPVKLNGPLTTDFLLLRNQGLCCYGIAPKITEWVNVHMSKGIKPILDQPVTICGTLHVGEIRENGYLVGIYRLDGERTRGGDQ